MYGSRYKTIILIKWHHLEAFASVAFIWKPSKKPDPNCSQMRKAPDRLWYPCALKSPEADMNWSQIWSNPVLMLLLFHPQARARAAKSTSSNRCASFTGGYTDEDKRGFTKLVYQNIFTSMQSMVPCHGEPQDPVQIRRNKVTAAHWTIPRRHCAGNHLFDVQSARRGCKSNPDRP